MHWPACMMGGAVELLTDALCPEQSPAIPKLSPERIELCGRLGSGFFAEECYPRSCQAENVQRRRGTNKFRPRCEQQRCFAGACQRPKECRRPITRRQVIEDGDGQGHCKEENPQGPKKRHSEKAILHERQDQHRKQSEYDEVPGAGLWKASPQKGYA